MPGSLDATAAEYYRVPKKMGKGAYLTIFDGKSPPRHENLNRIFASTQSPLVLGRQDTDRTQHIDIELSSYLISRLHGHFIKDINGRWKIQIQESVKYALFVNNVRMEERILEDGDELKIDDFANPSDSGVLILFSMKPAETWKECKLGDKDVVIGRNPEKSDICLEHISVSKKHAVIKHNGGNRVLVDARSNSGVIVNGKRVASCMLYERDVIRITNTKLIYYKNMIRYSTSVSGASIEATGLWQVGRKKKRFSLLTMFAKKNIIMQDVSLRIEPGELVAIIGGSGAGKSTLIYMLCGLKKPNQGQVSVSGLDLYSNFDALKTQIGYVPQSDIVQDNLKFKDMLSYSARIRLPGATPKEREKRIRKAIKAVDMGKHVNKYISDFSGGQKKRASIAIELLADPKLFFLDEPASGLDPYTEETLMKTLKNMADSGKTVVFVTHSPLSLRSCDKIVFIGAGGRLCFYGSYEQAIRFLFEDEVRNGTIKNPKDFDANRLVRIYEKITADSQEISEKFKMRTSGPPRPRKEEEKSPSKKRYAKSGTKTKFFSQAVILFQRNIALFLNDTGKVASVFVLSLVLAVFVTKVENGLQYTAYGITKSLYF
ncbi:MAG: ATP-binding cassette domain-containing protein, partial [Clostridiales bacterium]|nr:ATP-binding cassette domain-containing protein [Clostridiales bacterium]